MKTELSRIHAHVCGDGDIVKYVERRNKNEMQKYRWKNPFRVRYRVRYTNNNGNLLKEFSDDLKVFFGVRNSIWRNECKTKNKIVYFTLKALGAGGSRTWFVPKELFKSKKILRTAWLGAFCDDESTVDIQNKRLRIKCVNFSGINQVKDLFKSVDICSRVTGPNKDNTWYLTIYRDGLKQFANTIKLKSKDKADKIQKILTS